MSPTERLVLAWVAALLILIVVFLVGPMLPTATMLKDEKLAAWVQAIGSIVGIGIAIAVPALQHHFDNRRQEEERLRRVQGQYRLLISLADEFGALIRDLGIALHREIIRPASTASFPSDSFTAWRDRSRTVDLTLIDDQSASALTRLQVLAAKTETAFRTTDGGINHRVDDGLLQTTILNGSGAAQKLKQLAESNKAKPQS